jgi:glutamate synthase (NADPH) large chain
MVDLEPLDEDDQRLPAGDAAPAREETDSPVAARCSPTGTAALDRFTKVMPRDYKRACSPPGRRPSRGARRREAMAVMEATRG